MAHLQSKMEDLSLEKAYEKLHLYTALDNRIRLRALFLIADHPGVSFNELVRMTKVGTGLLAYHLGVLKTGELISFSYERRGKATSRYFLTDLGKSMVKELRTEIRKR